MKRVLLLDDDSDMRETLGPALIGRGIHVTAFSSFNEVEDWHIFDADLIVADWFLECGDTIEEFLPRAERAGVPVGLLTAVPRDCNNAREIAKRVVFYIVKGEFRRGGRTSFIEWLTDPILKALKD